MTLDERLERFVEPAVSAYRRAERALTSAIEANDPAAIEDARWGVLSAARHAAIELHQFADAVAAIRPAWLPNDRITVPAVREWVQDRHCTALRTNTACKDIDLVHDIADAFKHVELDKPSRRPRQVIGDHATVAMQTGYGQLPWSEGKFGGGEQLVVTLVDGHQRALSAVLQNALDAWRRALGRALPAIGE